MGYRIRYCTRSRYKFCSRRSVCQPQQRPKWLCRAGPRAIMDDDGVDSDLAELQKKYRAVDGDHKVFSEDSQQHLRKQRATIDKLKSDNEQLKEELQVERRHAKLYDSV